jgi:hypothetical protein
MSCLFLYIYFEKMNKTHSKKFLYFKMEAVFSILSSPFLFSSHNNKTVQETYLIKINMRRKKRTQPCWH